ncbi:MAG: glycosyl hydrolase family 28-related protein, partial [Sphingomonadaceae bacterium]|nr:glycosyl hydrolase family 28-related protein [Sphingomonadaceae bacterium]
MPKGGKLFIGEPFGDPEKKPLSIYFDAALTKRAPQPLIVATGSGEAIKAFAAAASYSVRIRDGSGRQTLYLAEVSGPIVLERLSLDPSPLVDTARRGLTGAAGTPSVTDFGAKGDGVTDDTAAIQSALDRLDHGGSLYFPPTGKGFYRISSSLRLPSRSGLSLFGPAGRRA